MKDRAKAAAPSPATQPSTQHAGVSEELRATLVQLRRQFESLSLQSSGLHHHLVERQRGFGIPEYSQEDFPPHLVKQGNPGDPHLILSWQTMLTDPPKPTALTEAERANAPPRSEGEPFIRDGEGNALAIWRPEVLRTGFLFGDHKVLDQFDNLASAAGHAISGIPDDALGSLPESVRELCRDRPTFRRRYRFGTVPTEPNQWMGQGWRGGMLIHPNGVVLDHMESGGIAGQKDNAWMLLLHRLGWEALAGSPLRASKWYWAKNHTVSASMFDHFPNDPLVKDVPRYRFLSALGDKSESTMDVCLASAWAIDRLLSLMA